MDDEQAHQIAVTVDAATARELDDAFWVVKSNNTYVVSVFIANVASIVPIGSDDDKIAAERGRNIYTALSPKTAMFGPHIAEQQASLLPGLVRPAILHKIRYSLNGERLSYEISATSVKSLAKLSYERFDSIWASQDQLFHKMIMDSVEIAELLWRERVGKVGMPGWESAFDASGEIVANHPIGLLAQTVVHEFMVAANVCATDYVTSKKVPMIYRNQGPRPGGPGGRYEISPLGHTALAVDAYGQFSSPIRIYGNLFNQRQIYALIEGKTPPYDISDVVAVCAASNKSAQKADSLSKQGNPIISRLGLEKMDSVLFRSLIARARGFDRRTHVELVRRMQHGLFYHEDLAWFLFAKQSPARSEERIEILRHLMSCPHEMATIWGIWEESKNGKPFSCRVRKNENVWTAEARIGRYAGTATHEDSKMARGLSLIFLAADSLGLDRNLLTPVTQAIRILDENAEDELYDLCEKMGWDMPVFNWYETETPIKRQFSGTIRIQLEKFVYETPIISASTYEGFCSLSSEFSLSQLAPYAKHLLSNVLVNSVPDLESLYESQLKFGSAKALEEFFERHGGSSEFIWTDEYPAINYFSGMLRISSNGNVLDVVGNGTTREDAVSDAASHAIEILLGKEDIYKTVGAGAKNL